MEEQWSTTQEEEAQYRQRLFRNAKKGDRKATQELQQTYGVRIWAEQERAGLLYENPNYKPPKAALQKLRKAAKSVTM